MSLCCHRFLSSSLWHSLLLHRRLFCLRRVWNLGGLCLLPGPVGVAAAASAAAALAQASSGPRLGCDWARKGTARLAASPLRPSW